MTSIPEENDRIKNEKYKLEGSPKLKDNTKNSFFYHVFVGNF